MKIQLANKKKHIVIVLIVFVVLSILAFNTNLKIVSYTVESDKITDTFRLALITDLHSCYYGQGQKELLNPISEQKPDIVLLGGDILDDVLPQENALIVLKELSKKYPCYYVSGNHEYWSNEIDTIKQTIPDCGLIMLEGECKSIIINGNKINICGIDDAEIGESTMLSQVSNSYEKADKLFFTLLLAHRPEYIEYYSNYDFDLILAGHAHGGQWRLPAIINGLYAPNQGFFPKYAGGQYNINETSFIVSRGLSRESTRVPRIFNRPELVIIDIVPSKM